jgi:endo-1,4-beta-mannosidase
MRRIILFCLLTASCATGGRKAASVIPPDDGIVRAQAGRFILDGRPIRFLGVNIYSLASRPEPHFSCGRTFTDQEVVATLSEVKMAGLNAVRVMAFPQFTDGGRDFSRFDLIVDEAERLGLFLIVTLDSQWGLCTGEGYRAAEWYRIGYRRPGADGQPSFREYARRFLLRYRARRGIAVIQIVNEAEARQSKDGGPDAPLALYAFAKDMSLIIKSIDPHHLVSLGTIGDEQNRSGAEGSYYLLLHSLDSIDIVEGHSYRFGAPNAVETCLETARLLKKPCLIGEIGIPVASDQDRVNRARLLPELIRNAFQDGVDGALVWSYRAGDGSHDFDPSDPLYDAIRRLAAELLKE